MATKANENHPCLCDVCLKARDAEIARVRESFKALYRASTELRDAWVGPITTRNIATAMKKQQAWHDFKHILANQYDAELTPKERRDDKVLRSREHTVSLL